MTGAQRMSLAGAVKYLRAAREARDAGDLAWAAAKLIDAEMFIGTCLGLDVYRRGMLARRYVQIRIIADAERARLVHDMQELQRSRRVGPARAAAPGDRGAVPEEILDEGDSWARGFA